MFATLKQIQTVEYGHLLTQKDCDALNKQFNSFQEVMKYAGIWALYDHEELVENMIGKSCHPDLGEK